MATKQHLFINYIHQQFNITPSDLIKLPLLTQIALGFDYQTSPAQANEYKFLHKSFIITLINQDSQITPPETLTAQQLIVLNKIITFTKKEEPLTRQLNIETTIQKPLLTILH